MLLLVALHGAHLTQSSLSITTFHFSAQVVLQVPSAEALEAAAWRLGEASIPFKLWVEQPENFPTCLATAPRRKSAVAPSLKRLPLCKKAI